MSWAERYRPRRFEDVLGQAKAVQTLAKLVQNNSGRSAVLFGPTGTGKTTLAEIYAKALMCGAPAPSGSPCGACNTCLEFESGRPPYEMRRYDPRLQNTDELNRIVNEIQPYAPYTVRRRVYFFDEAAKLGTRLETLYAELESPRHEATFIFTLLDIRALPPPAQDRLVCLELAPADPAECAGRLAEICTREGVRFEAEALKLLTEVSPSYRRSIENLEEVARHGRVTAYSVYEHIIAARVRWLVDYFEAVGSGDSLQQLAACDSAKLQPDELVTLLQDALVEVKLKDIGPSIYPGGPRYSLLSHDDRAKVANFARELAAETGQSAVGLWDAVMAFWQTLPAPLTHSSLRTHLLRFNDLVHGHVEGGRRQAAPARAVASPGSHADAAARKRLRGARPARRVGDDAGVYLTADQTAKIYAAASAALQARWAAFNFCLTVQWETEGERAASAEERASELMRQLGLRFEAWGCAETGGLARIMLQERPTGSQPITTVVGHAPVRHHDRFRHWIDEQQASERWAAKFELDLYSVGAWPAQLDRHWQLVRRLWRGVDPYLLVDSARALIDVLEVPQRLRRASGIVKGNRATSSGPLRRMAAELAEADAATVQNAFARKAWDQLFTRWERDRFDALQVARAEKARLADQLDRQFGGDDALHAAARARAERRHSVPAPDEPGSGGAP